MATPMKKQPRATAATSNAQPRASRVVRSREKFEEAKKLIAEYLSDGEWHRSLEVHQTFHGKIAEGTYGRVKVALDIEHRRVRSADGRVMYEWRRPEMRR